MICCSCLSSEESLSPVFLSCQVVRRFWNKNDMKGAIEAMKKMTDESVSAFINPVLLLKFLCMFYRLRSLLVSFTRWAYPSEGCVFVMQVLVEVLSVFMEKTNLLTLEICYLLIPLLNGLLSAEHDRFLLA